MLSVLPFLAFLLLWLLFAAGQPAAPEAPGHGRRAFLLAYVSWGVLLVVLLEALSLLGAIRQVPLGLAWLAVDAALAAACLLRGAFRQARKSVRTAALDLTAGERGLLGGIAIVCGMLFVVAVIAAPNNIDSLLYHMARVAHWAQNGSLNHYAAVYHHQLRMPPWAEMAALDLVVLSGGDSLVNLVQWSSMIACLILASGVAQLLGAERRGQILAAILVLSLPMVLLQATSTQNDLVTAGWLMALGYAVLLSLRDPADAWLPIVAGLALGLATLTKVTAAVYAPVFMIWLLVRRWRVRGGGRALRDLVLAGMVALAVNLPYMTRNVLTYGSPVGEVDFIVERLTVSEESFPGGEDGTPGGNPLAALWEGAGWAGARVARAAALNLVTPSFAINQALQRFLGTMPGLFSAKTIDSLQQAAWNHEDTAGNPVHLAIYLLAALAGLLLATRAKDRDLPLYLACSITGFILLPLLLTRGSIYFGIRYQLPFFVLWAPGVAVVLARLLRLRMVPWLSIGMLLLCLPWVLLNNTRPLIGMTPWPTRVESVLRADRRDVLFAGAPGLAGRYASMAREIERRDCRRVGLKIDSGDLEYLFWWTLRDAIDGVRIEIVDPLPSLSRYVDPAFSPCAIVCTICQGSDPLHGLPLIQESGRARLFAGEGYRPEAGE